MRHACVAWATLQRNTAALRKAGVTFGTGTDAGVTGTHHGWATLRELQLLVAGGLTALEAITAATGNAARAIKVDAERGTITAGKTRRSDPGRWRTAQNHRRHRKNQLKFFWAVANWIGKRWRATSLRQR
jgi:Imidazolonepropionase and related amidohydrolases